MARPMKLYSHSVAPNPRRVRIFAAEKGIDLTLEEVDILAGQSRKPEFLAKNSSGGVPVLELDDGSYLSESVAICRYLEGLQPEPNLLGRDVREEAEIERWNRRIEDYLWEQNFAALLEFKRREGHCRVKIVYKENDLKLGWWVATQRRNRKEMSAERRGRLDKIGFVWHAPGPYRPTKAPRRIGAPNPPQPRA
jgi:glutathione S-transferase